MRLLECARKFGLPCLLMPAAFLRSAADYLKFTIVPTAGSQLRFVGCTKSRSESV